ncbi:MAG: TRAP transporter small permease subunit [Pseudomonadales bacterium]
MTSSPCKQLRLVETVDRAIQAVGRIVCWLYVALIAVIIVQVVLRKGFSSGLIVFEELQWHLYAAAVMFGLAHAQTTNSHIRVDLLYSKFGARTKGVIDTLGILFLALPFVAVIFIHSLDFVYDAWRIGEHSDSPSGLPYRWLIKGVIPASMALLALALCNRIYRNLLTVFSRAR